MDEYDYESRILTRSSTEIIIAVLINMRVSVLINKPRATENASTGRMRPAGRGLRTPGIEHQLRRLENWLLSVMLRSEASLYSTSDSDIYSEASMRLKRK